MNDYQWDKKLKIQTAGRDDTRSDEYHYPYEPTPYAVLERLAQSGYIEKEHILLDYGCGKGRVGFFLNYVTGCKATGLEYDTHIFGQAQENQKTYIKRQNVKFVCADAESYVITDEDCFYFFNPFSVEILQSVIGKILDAYYNEPRQMRLFFYYPNDEYVACLMTMYELMFLDEIDCQDLFEGNNPRERILVFEIG